MKKYLFIFSFILIVSLLVSCASSSSGTPASDTTASNMPSQAAAQSGTGTTAAVSIENFSFSPATLTISAGTTVVWTNNDTAGHNIKSDSFNSPMLSKGQTFEFKFDNKGTYEYSCGVHPSMKGEIIVN